MPRNDGSHDVQELCNSLVSLHLIAPEEHQERIGWMMGASSIEWTKVP